QVSFQCRQKYLRSVTENDNTKGYWKGPYVNFDLDGIPLPFCSLRETVNDDDGVDCHVGNCAPETQPRHAAQRLQEGAGQKKGRHYHDPGGKVYWPIRKASKH
ncbi:hypothetical protein CHS0354_016012, partial [Potamilus streckersoni]